MQPRKPRSRRTVLQSLAGVGAVGLAGCLAPGATTDRPHEDDHGDHDHTPTEHGHEATEHDHTPTETHHHHEATEESHHHHEETLPDAPATSAEVGMVTTDDGGQHFAPHVVWVEPGGTVTWTLESGVHTTTAYAPENGKPRRIPEGAAAWDSGTMTAQGATFSHTFRTAGVYDYVCLPHESMGMVGTVVVGEPDVHHQPGMEPPDGSLPAGARQRLVDLNEMAESVLGHHPEE